MRVEEVSSKYYINIGMDTIHNTYTTGPINRVLMGNWVNLKKNIKKFLVKNFISRFF